MSHSKIRDLAGHKDTRGRVFCLDHTTYDDRLACRAGLYIAISIDEARTAMKDAVCAKCGRKLCDAPQLKKFLSQLIPA